MAKGSTIRNEFHPFNDAYTGLWHTTHTGLLVGQRYQEVVDRITIWLLGMYD